MKRRVLCDFVHNHNTGDNQISVLRLGCDFRGAGKFLMNW